MANVFVPSANDPAVFTTDKFPILKDGDGNTYRTVVKANVNGSIDVYSKGTGLFGGDELLFQYSGTDNKVYFRDGKFKNNTSAAFNSFFRASGSNGEQFAKDVKTKWYSEAPPNAATRMASLEGYQSIAATTPARQKPNGPQTLKIQTGAGTTTIVSPPGSTILNPPGADPAAAANFNLEISQETKKVEITTTPSILRYPLNYDSKNNNYDYLKIQVAKYVPGLSGGLQEGTIPTIQSVKTRITEKGTSVILPMYPGISESNSVDWGSDQLNPIQATFGAAAFNTIQGFATNPKGFAGALQNAGDQMSAAVRSLITNNPDLQTFISAYFAGQAVGANILGRTTGMVVNPNLELLFKGPQLRSFKYSYRFTPRDNKEAKEIRRIIKFFKREMAVQKNANNVFLKTPNVFFLDYIFKGNETNIHPFLNKIKPCALTSFNVNYTPDGTYMTYHDGGGIADGSMTSYSVDMQFDELEPIYRDDHSDSLDDPTMGY